MPIFADEELAYAIEQMRAAGTDLAEYEIKAAAGGFPKSSAETLSAFANTCGGTMIFGVAESGGFHAADGVDIKGLQQSCAQAARDLIYPAIAVDIRVLKYESRPVLVVNVPELSVRQKPCYVKKLGQMNGSFIRTGDGDHKMTLYEIDRFMENQNRIARNDSAVVPDATLADFDEVLLKGWLAHTRSSSFDRTSDMDDEELMANRRVISYDENGVPRPTLAGLLAMGSYPQKYFPRLNVVFTCYPMSMKGEVDASGSRFSDALNIDGPIPEMVVNAVKAVSRNIRHGAIVKGALREDVPDYPLPVVREAVANALMHRDYSVEGQGTPVMVDLYADRLEVYNPGGLFGTLTVERLGTRGATASRNQFIARILEDVPYTDFDGREGHVVENRGSGYPTINGELERALLDKPIVRSDLDGFGFVVRHRRMTREEGAGYAKANVEEAILTFIASRESVSSSEVAKAAGLSVKTTRAYIKRLVDDGTVEAIGTRNSPKRRYRLT